MQKILLGFILFCFITAAQAANVPAKVESENILVKTPEIKLMATGAASAEIFMQLYNKSDAPIKLIAANSPVALQTQLYAASRGKREAGKMHQVRVIDVFAKSDKELQQNGFHIMLTGLKQTLHPNDTVPVTLIFADGSSIQVQAKMG